MQSWVSKKKKEKEKRKEFLERKKKQPMFSEILGRSEKGKQTSFLRPNSTAIGEWDVLNLFQKPPMAL